MDYVTRPIISFEYTQRNNSEPKIISVPKPNSYASAAHLARQLANPYQVKSKDNPKNVGFKEDQQQKQAGNKPKHGRYEPSNRNYGRFNDRYN